MTGFKKIIASLAFVYFSFLPIDIGEKAEGEWFPFYIPWNYCKDSRVDFSFLLDAPAGKHGFLKARNGHLYFEDGKRAKFWGLNIHAARACFPTHEQAGDIARRLAQLGCNAVRMHFLDNESPDGIIDSQYDDSQHFSAEEMDRLDYFICQLKNNGIYTCFDVFGLGVRRFKPGDNVPEHDNIRRGAPGISFFEESIISLSKKFASDFLGHVNPYTGNSYLNEPCIAFIEMTNENTLFIKSELERFPPYYERKIGALWKEWLKAKGRASGAENERWSDDREFLFELQDNYQKSMHAYLRSIGVKIPIGSSNLPYDNLNLLADSRMDFTDMHAYWDLCDKLDRIHNRPMIKQSRFNPWTIVNTMAQAKVKGRPFVSTEWGSNWPNDWRAVDMLSVVSYAALNDWDALFLYSYNGGWVDTWDNLENKLYFGTVVFNDPAKMGIFPIAALIFLRGDISAARHAYAVSYGANELFEQADGARDRMKLAGIPYVSKIEKVFMDAPLKDTNYPEANGLSGEANTAVSDTGQITTDFGRGIFVLDTPRAVSFSGFIGQAKKGHDFKDVSFTSQSGFATVTLVSLESRGISDSGRLLLTVVGRARNQGQRFTPHVTKMHDDAERDVYVLSTGTTPILAEGVECGIFLKKRVRPGKIEVFALDEKGSVKASIPVEIRKGGYYFEVSGKYETIYYEIRS